MSQGRPSGRGQDPRRRTTGSGPRGASRRTSTPRPGPGARPGAGPGPRRGVPRQRTPGRGGQAAPRPRLTGRAAILVLVLAVLMVSYASSMRAYLEQRRHQADLSANISESRATIADLQREKKRWNDPAYVRTVAHQRFGWVLPGEIGFQVLDDDGKPLGHTDTLADPSAVTVAEQPQWWQSAWGSVVTAGKPEVARGDVPQPVTKIKPPPLPKEKR